MLDGRWLYVAALPLALVIVARRPDPERTLVALVALAHVVILANVALFPIPIDGGLLALGRAGAIPAARPGGVNLVPFATIGPVLLGSVPVATTRIAILNLFVLAPAGIYLPLLVASFRGWRALIGVALVGGVSVEAAQLAISALLGFTYRTIDIDDVILNTLGIVIGWSLARLAIVARERRLTRDRSAV